MHIPPLQYHNFPFKKTKINKKTPNKIRYLGSFLSLAPAIHHTQGLQNPGGEGRGHGNAKQHFCPGLMEDRKSLTFLLLQNCSLSSFSGVTEETWVRCTSDTNHGHGKPFPKTTPAPAVLLAPCAPQIRATTAHPSVSIAQRSRAFTTSASVSWPKPALIN